MGNSQVQLKPQSSKPILISHPEFQNAKISTNSQGKELVQIGISMKSQKDFLLWQKNYKRIPKIQPLLHPEEAKYENKGCCGSTGVASIQYQRYPYVLQEQIALRRNKPQGNFRQPELWHLLYSLLSCTQLFHIRKLKVGDIRPHNIFMNEQGSIKIATQFSFPYGSTNYEKTLMNREVVTYLAPEEVKDLQLGRMRDLGDPAKVEAFSIGLTLLDAAGLGESAGLYQANGIFSVNRLNESLQRLGKSPYSPQLIHTITTLCSPHPSTRQCLPQLLTLLKPFQPLILDQKPFNLLTLPSGNYHHQNPQSSLNISRISINNPKNNPSNKNKHQSDYQYITGVVFNQLDNSLQFSSLHQSKELIYKSPSVKDTTNTYEVRESGKINPLTSPVRTTIHQPPIVISLPQPIEYGNHNHSGQGF